ncbi:MAG: ferric reductase [Nostocoides sp.]
MTSPLLWHLNRGTGVVLLALFTATTLIGVLATGRGMSPWWPRFLTQGLHRRLAGLSVGLLAVHVVTAVVDEYVDIRWWQAFVPFGAAYKPLWLSFGTLALDLTVIVAVTSLARAHLPHRLWHVIHLSTYLCWVFGAVHGLGIGTDTGTAWLRAINAVCLGLVLLAAGGRLAAVARANRAAHRLARLATVTGGTR